MTQLENDITVRACRHDGWTEVRRAKFLECLAATANVRTACAAAGLSRQAAYRLQKPDPEFAAAWRDALREAHAAAARAFLELLPESLRRTLSGSSTGCNFRV